MPTFGPISRRDLIRHLRQLGFDGPYSGGKHEFVIRGNVTLVFPIRTVATSVASFCLAF
jgi:hypothetical protein